MGGKLMTGRLAWSLAERQRVLLHPGAPTRSSEGAHITQNSATHPGTRLRRICRKIRVSAHTNQRRGMSPVWAKSSRWLGSSLPTAQGARRASGATGAGGNLKTGRRAW